VKAIFFRRLGAFIIDYFIVILILSIVTMGFKNDSDLIKKTDDLVNSYVNEEITLEEYNKSIIDINYRLQKNNVFINGISCILYIGYFVVFSFLNKGQTLGKKILRLRVVSKDKEIISIGRIFVRSLFIYGILSSLYSCIFVNFFNPNMFNTGSILISYIETLFIVICFFMILYRKDKRGLHDVIAGTKVIGEVK